MIDVVKTAKAMGYYTIVADNVKGSPAKAFADQFFDESTADIPTLAEIVHAEKMAGVFTAFEDINKWFGRFNLVAETEQALHQAIETLCAALKIESADGKSMVLAKHEPANVKTQ